MFPLHLIAEILRTASEDIGLTNCVIKFHVAKHVIRNHQRCRRTDGQTPYDGNTAPLL